MAYEYDEFGIPILSSGLQLDSFGIPVAPPPEEDPEEKARQRSGLTDVINEGSAASSSAGDRAAAEHAARELAKFDMETSAGAGLSSADIRAPEDVLRSVDHDKLMASDRYRQVYNAALPVLGDEDKAKEYAKERIAEDAKKVPFLRDGIFADLMSMPKETAFDYHYGAESGDTPENPSGGNLSAQEMRDIVKKSQPPMEDMGNFGGGGGPMFPMPFSGEMPGAAELKKGAEEQGTAIAEGMPRSLASGLGSLIKFGTTIADAALQGLARGDVGSVVGTTMAGAVGGKDPLALTQEQGAIPGRETLAGWGETAGGVQAEVASEREEAKRTGASTELSRMVESFVDAVYQAPQYFVVPEMAESRVISAVLQSLPASYNASKERYEQLIKQGAEPAVALEDAGLTAIVNTVAAAVPMGQNSLLRQTVTGAVVNPATAEAQRQAEKFILPEKLQTDFDWEEAIKSSFVGGLLPAAMTGPHAGANKLLETRVQTSMNLAKEKAQAAINEDPENAKAIGSMGLARIKYVTDRLESGEKGALWAYAELNHIDNKGAVRDPVAFQGWLDVKTKELYAQLDAQDAARRALQPSAGETATPEAQATLAAAEKLTGVGVPTVMPGDETAISVNPLDYANEAPPETRPAEEIRAEAEQKAAEFRARQNAPKAPEILPTDFQGRLAQAEAKIDQPFVAEAPAEEQAPAQRPGKVSEVDAAAAAQRADKESAFARAEAERQQQEQQQRATEEPGLQELRLRNEQRQAEEDAARAEAEARGQAPEPTTNVMVEKYRKGQEEKAARDAAAAVALRAEQDRVEREQREAGLTQTAEQKRKAEEDAAYAALHGTDDEATREAGLQETRLSTEEKLAQEAAERARGEGEPVESDLARQLREKWKPKEEAPVLSADEETENGIPQDTPTHDTAATAAFNEAANRHWAKPDGPRADFVELRRDAMPEHMAQALQVSELFTGARVAVITERSGNRGEVGPRFNGTTLRKGVLYIHAKTSRPVVHILGHEWVHQLKVSNNRLFHLLQNEVKRQGRVEEYTKDRTSIKGDKEKGLEELTADASGDGMGDIKFMKRLAKENPEVFTKIAHDYGNYLDRFLGQHENLGSNRYMREVAQFREVLADVLHQHASERFGLVDKTIERERPRIAASLALRDETQGRRDPQIDEPAFKEFFGKSHVTDDLTPNGEPLRVLHGTTGDFSQFSRRHAIGNGDWGKGFYFTNSHEDAAANYANLSGPDLQAKLEGIKESIIDNADEPISDEDALRMAQEQLDSKNQGFTMPAYLRMENPVKLGTHDETHWDLHYNEETGEETGELADFHEALLRAGESIDEAHGIDEAWRNVLEHVGPGEPAAKYLEALKDDYYDAYDDGEPATNELIRRALEYMGYDGIIDQTVDNKFGTARGRRGGKGMAGVDPDTIHFISFDGHNVKSATGNRGTWDRREGDITMREEEGQSAPKSKKMSPEEKAARKAMTPEERAAADDAKKAAAKAETAARKEQAAKDKADREAAEAAAVAAKKVQDLKDLQERRVAAVAAAPIRPAPADSGNKHGFWPALRQLAKTRRNLPEKASILAGTNNKNAQKQLDAIDKVLKLFPNATDSIDNWSAMMAHALADRDVPVAPFAAIRDWNSNRAAEKLRVLTAGQLADADHGFENGAVMRKMYTSGEMSVETTGKLFLWSFLSRGVSPYTQESLFIDAFNGADKWIRKAAEGKFTEADLPEYKAWVKTVAPKGTGVPGAGAAHNLGAFGRNFLMKMGEVTGNGKTGLQNLHDKLSSTTETGKSIRRYFATIGEGAGIDNKVVSFTMLVAGHNDVMVLDRVQIRQLWDDGRFEQINLYDGKKEPKPLYHGVDEDGEPTESFTVNDNPVLRPDGSHKTGQAMVPGSSLGGLSEGARGILVYEALERGLEKRLPDIYGALGRPQDASLGRYHWESWVADSQQEASHGTLGAILHDAKGDDYAIAKVYAKEGEYGSYAYGAEYKRLADGSNAFAYTPPGGQKLQYSVPAFRAFLDKISKTAAVKPSKFKVSDSGNQPWFNRPEVNREKLRELAEHWSNDGEGGRRILAESSASGADAARQDAGEIALSADDSRAERRAAIHNAAQPFIDERVARGAGDAKAWGFTSRSVGTDRGNALVKAVHEPTEKLREVLVASGATPVAINELTPHPINVNKFHDAITASKESNKFGAAVYVYPKEEYADMRLFTTADGKSGFAIKKDGDVVSGFTDGGRKMQGMLHLATELGGTKADCFDTILPDLYAINGFKITTRTPWNEEYKPEGWDKKAFSKFNNGEPDVVELVYDPAYNPLHDEAPLLSDDNLAEENVPPHSDENGDGEPVKSIKTPVGTLHIENPAGSTRNGKGEDGKPFSRVMKHDYGYIDGVPGRDGGSMDVLLGEGAKNPMRPVFVVHQKNAAGGFDEHKVLVGFANQRDAERAYLSEYPKGWDRMGKVEQMPAARFKEWAKTVGREEAQVGKVDPSIPRFQVRPQQHDAVAMHATTASPMPVRADHQGTQVGRLDLPNASKAIQARTHFDDASKVTMAHQVVLRNLYDVHTDPRDLFTEAVRTVKAKGLPLDEEHVANEFENHIVAAGFDGYRSQDGKAVVLGGKVQMEKVNAKPSEPVVAGRPVKQPADDGVATQAPAKVAGPEVSRVAPGTREDHARDRAGEGDEGTAARTEEDAGERVSERASGETEDQGVDPLTAMRDRAIKQVRINRKAEPLERIKGKDVNEIEAEAHVMMQRQPGIARMIAEEVAKKSRNLSDVESAVLAIDRQRIEHEHNEAHADVEKWINAKNTEEEALARVRMKHLEEARDNNEKASKNAGREWSSSGRARNLAVKRDESLVSLLTKQRVANGGGVSDEQRKTLVQQAAKIEQLKKQIASPGLKQRPEMVVANAKKEFADAVAQLKKLPKEEHMTKECAL